jgi:hypothetical protein
MFTELKKELLDLRVTEKGYRNALYANTDHGGASSSSTASSSSLCSCTKLCW